MKHFLSRGYPKPLRLMACLIAMIAAISTMAQNQIQVTGTVVDNNGEPVIGATIWEKGTKNNRIVTGLDGDFTIRTKSDATIAVSCVGFTTKEVKVTTAPMHIVISEDAKMLEDMVVIGYGSISKKEVTSAVSHVSSKDMLQIGSSNPAMQMQGKVSGLTIDNTASSDPNHSPGIQIRGVSSRSGGIFRDTPPESTSPAPSNGKETPESGIAYGDQNSGRRLIKYPIYPSDDPHKIESDYAMIRLPEIIYYLAEIKFKKGEKAEAERLMNTVRYRYYPAGSKSLYPEDGSKMTEQELLDEWGREFLGEGMRRQTLCRFGVYNTGTWWDKTPDADNHTMFLPLSRAVLGANPNLKQNPGYPSI